MSVLKGSKYPKVSLQGLLEKATEKNPEKTALIYNNREISYSELNRVSNQFSNFIAGHGIKKGDRVALFMPNIPQFAIAFFGVLKAGAVVTTISPLHREREVAYQLQDSGARIIVATNNLEPIITKIEEHTQLDYVLVTSMDEVGFFGFLKDAPYDKLPMKIDPTKDLAALQYTGGTTGTPKAAMLTHQNLVANALQFAYAIKGSNKDIFLAALPLFHIYGLTTSMTTPISLGAKIALLPKFEATKACRTIECEKITVFCGVPTMYQHLLAKPDLADYDLRSLRVCISGAAPLPPQVQNQFMRITGGTLAEGYGLTEASPVTHCSPVEKGQIRVGSVGLPLRGTEAYIVDQDTGQKILSYGEIGELAVRGPQIMRGYWDRPDETIAILRDGLFLTGDIAKIDADGYLYIVDRKKDLIKHNGYSVYPRELEEILQEHPAIKQCTVIGIPDFASGEIPKAFVVLKEGTEASVEELKIFVNSKVAVYKGIRQIEFRNELPVSSVGKVLRNQLRQV